MVGLPLFGKKDSGTPVFKILVRALIGRIFLNKLYMEKMQNHTPIMMVRVRLRKGLCIVASLTYLYQIHN